MAMLADFTFVLRTAENLGSAEIRIEIAGIRHPVIRGQAARERIAPAAHCSKLIALVVPQHLGSNTNLAQIVEALGFPGPVTTAGEAGQEHAGEDRNNRHHHQQLDECEGEPLCFNGQSDSHGGFLTVT